MPTLLQRGSSGETVKRLQRHLTILGFDTKGLDGLYGANTEEAVRKFQKGRGYPVTGTVSTRILSELRFPEHCFFTVDLVSKILPKVPKANIQQHLPRVLAAMDELTMADRPMLCMAIATIRAESAGFVPISEYVSRYNTSKGGQPFDLYDVRQDLGNQNKGDGARFKGRGFIQLTGQANYRTYSRLLGMGDTLVDNPELANEPDIAAQLLACFLKRAESRIRQALDTKNYRQARRLVNGGTHGLAAFQEAFKTGMAFTAMGD